MGGVDEGWWLRGCVRWYWRASWWGRLAVALARLESEDGERCRTLG